jgi:hypothetical protein
MDKRRPQPRQLNAALMTRLDGDMRLRDGGTGREKERMDEVIDIHH